MVRRINWGGLSWWKGWGGGGAGSGKEGSLFGEEGVDCLWPWGGFYYKKGSGPGSGVGLAWLWACLVWFI